MKKSKITKPIDSSLFEQLYRKDELQHRFIQNLNVMGDPSFKPVLPQSYYGSSGTLQRRSERISYDSRMSEPNYTSPLVGGVDTNDFKDIHHKEKLKQEALEKMDVTGPGMQKPPSVKKTGIHSGEIKMRHSKEPAYTGGNVGGINPNDFHEIYRKDELQHRLIQNLNVTGEAKRSPTPSRKSYQMSGRYESSRLTKENFDTYTGAVTNVSGTGRYSPGYSGTRDSLGYGTSNSNIVGGVDTNVFSDAYRKDELQHKALQNMNVANDPYHTQTKSEYKKSGYY